MGSDGKPGEQRGGFAAVPRWVRRRPTRWDSSPAGGGEPVGEGDQSVDEPFDAVQRANLLGLSLLPAAGRAAYGSARVGWSTGCWAATSSAAAATSGPNRSRSASVVSYLDRVTEMAPTIPESSRNGAATPAASGMCWPVLVTKPCRFGLVEFGLQPIPIGDGFRAELLQLSAVQRARYRPRRGSPYRPRRRAVGNVMPGMRW